MPDEWPKGGRQMLNNPTVGTNRRLVSPATVVVTREKSAHAGVLGRAYDSFDNSTDLGRHVPGRL